MTSAPKLVYGEDELASLIAVYEAYHVNVESFMITEKEMNEKGDMFLFWVNQLLASKLRTINQITQRSIEIFKQISIDEVDISSRILELQNACAQKNTAIQNHVDTIRHLENKLIERDNDIEKLKEQIIELTLKIDKQQSKFKRETKEFKKTFAIIQETSESDKQIFDSIQFEYEYEKQQHSMIKDQLDALIEEKAVFVKELQECKRLYRASENKLEWEIKKKLTLEEVITEKNLLIDRLLFEIKDLKDMYESPYGRLDEDNHDVKDLDDVSQAAREPVDKNILSEQMALRQSFFSEADLDDDFMRRNSFRKSFDEGPNPSENQFDYPGENQGNGKKIDSINQNGYHTNKQNSRPKKGSFHEDHYPISREDKPKSSTSNNRSMDQSPNSIMIRDMQNSRSPGANKSTQRSQHQSPLKRSPQVNGFQSSSASSKQQSSSNNNKNIQKQQELQIITQKVQCERRQSMEPFRRHVPDLYFAHFLLTSQAVKIKEDCEQMLNIDVKQYYQEIIQKRVPMHIWDDWVREKLRIAVKELRAKYQNERKRQNSKFST